MFGGFVSGLYCDRGGIVAQFSQNLVVLDAKSLKKMVQIDTQVISFGVLDQQLVTLNENGLVEFYLLRDGTKLNSLQLNYKKIRSAYYSHNNFVLLSAKKLILYNLIDQEATIIQESLEFTKNSKITISYNGILTAISIDQKLFISEKKHCITYTHPTCITSIALHQRQVAVGDVTGKILISESTMKQISRPPQWHAHAVTQLKFGCDGEYLYSAGKEGVVLQWHIHTQRKQFFPRQGNEIVALDVQQDRAIIAIKGTNTVKAIQLQGGSDPAQFQGIQTNPLNNQSLQLDTKTVIMNGIAGQLQQVDIRTGQFVRQIDITRRNYVSELDSGTSAEELDIQTFQLSSDKSHLCCSVQLLSDKFYIGQLKFFHIDERQQFNCITTFQRPHKDVIRGIESSFSNQWKSDLFVSWSSESIRLWKLTVDKKLQQYWTCIYHGCFTNICGVQLRDDRIAILTTTAIMILNPLSNQIESEVIFNQTLNIAGKHLLTDNLLIESLDNQLFIFNIDSKLSHQITLAVDHILDFKVHNNQQIYLSATKGQNAILIIYDIVSKSIIRANQHNEAINNIFVFNHKTVVDYYALNKVGTFFHVFSLSNGKQKRSSFIEEEALEEETQVVKENELPQFQNAFTQQLGQNSSQFERLFYAEQARKLYFLHQYQTLRKELNVNQFFPQQSHLIPPTLIIARRVAQYLTQQVVESLPEYQIQSEPLTQDLSTEEISHVKPTQLNYLDFVSLKDHISKLQLK